MTWYNTTTNFVNDFTYSTGTNDLTFNVDAANTIEFPDPLIDWLPNSCLYVKYVPTWHLVRSYKH